MDRRTQLLFRKSSYSGSGENCVEGANLPGGGMAVRDSKVIDGPVLRFSAGEWQAFIAGVKAGEFEV